MGIDPTGLNWSLVGILAGVGLATAVGGYVGYKMTGTLKGSVYGAVAGFSLAMTLVLYKHDPTLWVKAVGYSIASVFVGAAGYLGDINANKDRFDDTELMESILRAVAITNTVIMATGLLKAGQDKLIASFYNNHKLMASIVTSSVVEVSKSAIDGKLWRAPLEVMTKIGTSSITTYLTLLLGASPLHSAIAGFAVARAQEAAWDIIKYFTE